jgi:glycine oxidase
MPPRPDVLVVGGGAVGAATARALAAAGRRVRLLRPAAPLPGEASRAAAGKLAAQVETTLDDPVFTLGVAGRAYYRREAEALREATGIDIGFQQRGILQVATESSQVERFKDKVAWQRQAAESADVLTPEEVAEGWPWLDPGYGAFWAPEDGSLHPDRLVEALLADAMRLGAEVVEDTVTSLWQEGAAMQGVLGRDRHSAGVVVIAAGAWSGRIAGLPRPLSVEPVRGQLLAWPWPEGQPAATVYGDRCYLMERDGELIAGATMEHAGFDAGVSEASAAAMLARVEQLAPRLDGVPPARRWAGLRPGTPDAMPIIGQEPRLPGLWYATGHGRNGILLAGITGELIAQAIGGEALPDAALAFRPERFWSW